MSTENYNVNNPIKPLNMKLFSKDIISELKQLGYIIREQDDLVMAKTTDQVQVHRLPATPEHGPLDLKGLIMSRTDSGLVLVAPGCPVPLEEPNIDTEIQCYTEAMDGIMYRLYYHDNKWKYSTPGRITPNTSWGPKGTPTFTELMDDAIKAGLVVFKDLIPGECYYVMLQHPKFTNLVKHEQLKVTVLFGIMCESPSLKRLNADVGDYGFKSFPVYFPDPPVCEVNSEPHPLSDKDMGYVVLYKDGTTYRHETASFKRANEIRPNLADPAQQWANVLSTGGMKLVDEFVEWFPHHKPQFQDINDRFINLIDTIVRNYKDIDQNGWGQTVIPARHVSYMRHLTQELQVPSAKISDVELCEKILDHLLNEDPKRIFYLVNPYDVAPKQHA